MFVKSKLRNVYATKRRVGGTLPFNIRNGGSNLEGDNAWWWCQEGMILQWDGTLLKLTTG